MESNLMASENLNLPYSLDAEQAVIHENSHPIEDRVIRAVQVQNSQELRIQCLAV